MQKGDTYNVCIIMQREQTMSIITLIWVCSLYPLLCLTCIKPGINIYDFNKINNNLPSHSVDMKESAIIKAKKCSFFFEEFKLKMELF